MSLFPGGRKKRDGNQEFEKKLEHYKETYKNLVDLEESFQNHLKMTTDYMKSCAKLGVQIAFFFNKCDPKVADRTRDFGQVNAEMEAVVLKSVTKLYTEEVLDPMGVIKVLDGEIQKAIKQRKKLISSEAKKLKNWQAKLKEKESIEELIKAEQLKGKGPTTNMFGKKRKSISEVNREVIDKERLHKEAVEKQEELTALIIQKFDSLEMSYRSGELISSPVSGILASQFHLCQETLKRLKIPRTSFREHQVFAKTLEQYDRAQLEGDTLDNTGKSSPKGFVFGRVLTLSTPDVVCDCMEYIKQAIKAEGLFRIPGNRVNVEAIQEAYDKNEKTILNVMTDIDVHDVCSALKYFFHELPEPLIPFDTYTELEEYFDGDSGGKQPGRFDDHAIVGIIQRISAPNIGLIGLLLNFLHDITKFSSDNQMTSSNLATCFAPALLKARPDKSTPANIKNMKNLAANIATVTVLIDCARQFGVPDQETVQQHTNITEETKARVNRIYLQHLQMQRQAQAQIEGLPSPKAFMEPSAPGLPVPQMKSPVPPSPARPGQLSPQDLQDLQSQNQANNTPKPVIPPMPRPAGRGGSTKNRKLLLVREPLQVESAPQVPAKPIRTTAPPLPPMAPPKISTQDNDSGSGEDSGDGDEAVDIDMHL